MSELQIVSYRLEISETEAGDCIQSLRDADPFATVNRLSDVAHVFSGDAGLMAHARLLLGGALAEVVANSNMHGAVEAGTVALNDSEKDPVTDGMWVSMVYARKRIWGNDAIAASWLELWHKKSVVLANMALQASGVPHRFGWPE